MIQAAKEQARVYLREGRSFVWNATNITRQLRSQLIDLFESYRASVDIVYIEMPYGLLTKQNMQRMAVVPLPVL
ncbi:AAA family ATPase [Chitinophaga pendula]|uniref:AAA family ATPase n=1 Tax=Chitinophaga TaxID=79328 RepID=UPI000BAED58F|nr:MULTISPECIES: AAA family ATPase [Chitinophaga]ASZ14029.1 hypothetical protein CK934_25290 [Chitinophaga sp. MD30]UCJ08342.1 AAA family ATPase [Chitinophaga pendula]